MHSVLTMLSADCKLAARGKLGIDRCGAFFPDLGSGRPPDEPAAAKPRLRVVR